MPGRDNALWRRCWRERDTAFHQDAVNGQLVRYWPSLGLAPADRVFVPLCGKSLDMLWLARQGHEVIGVELSPIAVRAFFQENGLPATSRKAGPFTLWESGRIRILCGDFFRLTAAHLGDIAAVFDRASLTALPEDLRVLYAARLLDILPPACRMLLLTTEEAVAGEEGYQADGADAEITRLYQGGFDIRLQTVESVLEADPAGSDAAPLRVERKAYVLIPR